MKITSKLLTPASFLLLLSLSRTPLHADLGVKLGESISGSTVKQQVADARISAKTLKIEEKKIGDVVDNAARRGKATPNFKSERIEAARKTTERIRIKKKKLITR